MIESILEFLRSKYGEDKAKISVQYVDNPDSWWTVPVQLTSFRIKYYAYDASVRKIWVGTEDDEAYLEP